MWSVAVSHSKFELRQYSRNSQMTETPELPVIDLSSPDRISTANSIRQACIEYGFFYLVNHGVEGGLLEKVFEESGKFFSLSLEEKMKLVRRENRGYTPLYTENLDPSSHSKGDSKESFYIGPLEGAKAQSDLNQWPSEDKRIDFATFMTRGFQNFFHHGGPQWNLTIKKVLSAGKRLIHIIALALNVHESLFEEVGALDEPAGFLRLLRYQGELSSSDEEICGASAHSDYGMITLLATNGVQGLQICREKFKQPRVWEDVPSITGVFIVNIGDMMERWTNCLFRSTLHRVMPAGQDRFSVAFFLDPNEDCVVECLESCCSESSPRRFPPIRSGDYLKERFRLTYGS